MAHITVELRTSLEGGVSESLDPPAMDVGRSLPDFDDRRYPLLRLIDPYGDTIFSSYQMVELIPELRKRHLETDDEVLREVIRLAEACQGKRSFLVFMGD